MADNYQHRQKFGPDNSGLNITGGAFYNSPFAQNITMSLEVPQDQFVGTYQLEQDAATTSGTVGLGDGYLFGPDATTTVELKIDPSNTLNGRVFKTDAGGYFDGGGFGTEIDSIRVAFTQNPATGDYYTTVTNQAGTGLTCQNVSAGIVLGAPAEVSLESNWDPNNDNQFGLTIAEDVLGDCAPSNPITFTLTKQ
ncbi:MAG: hypothetical protein U5K69_06130 [Balneolaceae bacterium]|nr:hypothetical protein [Balneolaceae bacterium]